MTSKYLVNQFARLLFIYSDQSNDATNFNELNLFLKLITYKYRLNLIQNFSYPRKV